MGGILRYWTGRGGAGEGLVHALFAAADAAVGERLGLVAEGVDFRFGRRHDASGARCEAEGGGGTRRRLEEIRSAARWYEDRIEDNGHLERCACGLRRRGVVEEVEF